MGLKNKYKDFISGNGLLPVHFIMEVVAAARTFSLLPDDKKINGC